MTDVLDGVRDHYRASGLTERLKTALIAFGPDESRLTPQQLATAYSRRCFSSTRSTSPEHSRIADIIA